MDLTINITDAPASGHIEPKDSKGNKPLTAPQTGTTSYSSSNEAVFTVEEDPDDETKFTITPVGVGEADLNASIDADPGDGVVTVTGTAHVTVTPDEAVKLDVVFP